MRHKRNFVLALLVLFAMPLLACDPNVLNAWGDLLASAQFIWDSIWTVPEPDYEAIGSVPRGRRVSSLKALILTW